MSYRDELDTPCLVVHQEILEQNIDEMARYAREHGIDLRPHQKTHKTAEIARMQLEAGAIGGTCAKIGEAEALVDAGALDDVLLAYQVVGPRKIARLLDLMRRAHVTVAVDGLDGAQRLSQAMEQAGQQLDVLIEVNTGLNRAGLRPGEEVLELAREVKRLPGLQLRGIFTHEGHVAQATTPDELAFVARRAGENLVATAELLREHNIPVEVVSVGSTPAAFATTGVEGITEMRPGTYVFNDNSAFRMGRIGPERCALRILTTVISRPAPDRAVVDAGSKTLAMDPSPQSSGSTASCARSCSPTRTSSARSPSTPISATPSTPRTRRSPGCWPRTPRSRSPRRGRSTASGSRSTGAPRSARRWGS